GLFSDLFSRHSSFFIDHFAVTSDLKIIDTSVSDDDKLASLNLLFSLL
ncbi:14678_t:CDS:1, partial [Funneliformis mosseae]